MTRNARSGIAGAVAATLWAAADPALERVFGTPYSDSKLVGPFITEGPLEPAAGLVAHVAGGLTFGYVFGRLGGRGVRSGIVAAVAENTLLWPMVGVLDRIHPKRRSGEWPPLVSNPRVFAQATAGHALFGALLGVFSKRA